jgi:hypothetical protein
MTRSIAAVVLGISSLLGACSPRPEPVGIDDAVDLISEAALQAHVSYLASDELEGRMTGEPGYDKAAAYVAQQFEAIGLVPGGTDGWYQPVPLAAYQLLDEGAGLTLHAAAGDEALAYRDDFSVSGDPLREATSIRAGVVYVGYGVHAPEKGYSDYEGVDVAGKIVAMFRNAPAALQTTERAYYASSDHKLPEAVRRGAVGVISLRSREREEKYPWARHKDRIGKRPGMTWLTSDGDAASHYPELIGRAGLANHAAEKLFANAPQTFEQVLDGIAGGDPVSLPLGIEVTIRQQSGHRRLQSPNVIGMLRGSDPELADEYLVYSAHLDHVGILEGDGDDSIYNGAYDNAIGVALMIEAARALAAVKPARSVLFVALTGEERGLLGSEYFAEYPTVPRDAIVANINIDMPLFLYPVADVIAFGAQHSNLAVPAEAAAMAEGFMPAPDPKPEENFFVRSDQYSFVRKGIPALYLDVGTRSKDPNVDADALYEDHLQNHYHEPSDDLSRPVHWDSARRFARANARVGYAVATAAGRPRWNEGDFFGERFASP